MNLGEKLYELRTGKNLSQGDVADALEVSRQSVSKWENNSAVPDLDKIIKLAELFEVSLDELVLDKKAEGQEASPQPQIIIQKEASGRKTAGTILLCMAFLVLLLLTIIGGAEGLIMGVLFAMPFVICAVICFTVKQHTGLWCAWVVYVCADAFLRVVTGINWKLILWTPYFTADMNYARLAIGWIEFIVMLAMMVWTIWTFAKESEQVTKKALLCLIGGTVLMIGVNSIFGTLLVYRWSMIVSALFDWLIKVLFMAAVVAAIRYIRGRKENRK